MVEAKTSEMDPKPPPPQPSSATLLRHLIHLDTTLSHNLYKLTDPVLPYSLLKFLEISGDGFLFFPLLLSLLLFPSPTTTSTALLLDLLIGGLLDLLLIGILKHLIRRPRPVYNSAKMFVTFSPDHWSFPSGHSSRVFFIATFCLLNSSLIHQLLLLSSSSALVKGKFTAIALLFFAENFVFVVLAWALLTSISRILLGRHFVLDVVAGTILGVLEGIFVFWVLNYRNLTSFFGHILCEATKGCYRDTGLWAILHKDYDAYYAELQAQAHTLWILGFSGSALFGLGLLF